MAIVRLLYLFTHNSIGVSLSMKEYFHSNGKREIHKWFCNIILGAVHSAQFTYCSWVNKPDDHQCSNVCLQPNRGLMALGTGEGGALASCC